jgi:hypothetical protein
VRDSVLISVLLGIPAAVFATSISNALSKKEPDWVYVAFAISFVVSAVLIRIVLGLVGGNQTAAQEESQHGTVQSRPRSLAEALGDANSEVVFEGVIAKRSINDDAFRRTLERGDKRHLRIRLLLLDPKSSTFDQRAIDEGESAKSWRLDLQATLERLSLYKREIGRDIECRLSSDYPAWRMIIVDRTTVLVSTFLPSRRGTESTQHVYHLPSDELAHGFIQSFQGRWKRARKVEL